MILWLSQLLGHNLLGTLAAESRNVVLQRLQHGSRVDELNWNSDDIAPTIWRGGKMVTLNTVAGMMIILLQWWAKGCGRGRRGLRGSPRLIY